MRDITLVELLKSGVHFGHQVSKWHPKMRPFIFTSRAGVYIIDLEKTSEHLKRAQEFVRDLVSKGGTVLFVGTKRQAKPIIETTALHVGMPYVVERWIGGTITNFNTISKMTKRLSKLKEERASGLLEKYTKKEQLNFNDEIQRLERMVGGIERMLKLPEAVFIVDIKHEKSALREAQHAKIPIIALVDTNVSPEGITKPIPANDDSTKSIQIITESIVEALEEGRRLFDQQRAQVSALVPIAVEPAKTPQGSRATETATGKDVKTVAVTTET